MGAAQDVPWLLWNSDNFKAMCVKKHFSMQTMHSVLIQIGSDFIVTDFNGNIAGMFSLNWPKFKKSDIINL